MKTQGKIKLNQFSKAELDRRALNALKGGCKCMAGYSNIYTMCPSTNEMSAQRIEGWINFISAY